jgi:N-methylhydantoinase A
MEKKQGLIASYKVDTTPAQLESCFLHGLRRATDGIPSESVGRILHATTVATNTVLESKGARTALVTTQGFRDILEIARQRRPSLYDLKSVKAKPLIPRRLCFEVNERIGWDGGIATTLTEDELDRLAKTLQGANIESVVIALLFSFVNPAHEIQIKARLEKSMPGKYIIASSEITPEFREFERTSTAALVGYLKPIFFRYTENLTREVSKLGHGPEKLLIMNSAGGVMSPESARERPHTLIESGPAAGVIAAAQLAHALDEPNLISFDMGGTTAKASLIEGGAYKTTTEYEIGMGMHQSLAVRFTGYPVKTPVIDLTECGAGGGSIASVDGVGVLKVGPQSAGAEPGPVCYGRGGTEPTVTDANLVLGRLNPAYFVGGESTLDLGSAEKAIEEKIARPLGLSLMEAASGILEVVNAHMVRTLRVISVARGYDPRDFSLVSFGGAGPLHAADLASELQIPRIVIPEAPGVFSALGLLWADLRADFTATARLILDKDNARRFSDLITELEGEANRWLDAEKVPLKQRALIRSADMRYPLQNYEINVPLPNGKVSPAWLGRARSAFHQAHLRQYSYSDEAENVQAVNLRVSAVGYTSRMAPLEIPAGKRSPRNALKGERRVYFQEVGNFLKTPIYERSMLLAGNRIQGPAVIEQPDSTVLVPPSFLAEVDPHGRLEMNAVKRKGKTIAKKRNQKKVSKNR